MNPRLRPNEDGFTLIELLVTIVIIGILSAIAFPALTSQRFKAQDSSAKSDIRNASVQMETCFTQEGTYGPCDEALLASVGFPNVWTYGYRSATGYYIETQSKTGTRFGLTRSPTGITRNCYYRRQGGSCAVNDGPW